MPDAVRDHTLGIIRDRYVDFGPTLAREKLLELHGVSVALETLRIWMIEGGIWRAMFVPDNMRRWMLPPPGFTMTTCECDARVGGALRIAWKSQEAIRR